jgi:hypothetical protein
MLDEVVSVAPTRATSSAIRSAFRVAVPSSSIAAVKFARPGESAGLAPLPLANTRLAETTGNSRRSLTMTRSPLGSVK